MRLYVHPRLCLGSSPASAEWPGDGCERAELRSRGQWTTQKVNRLVFDTSVTPRWLESGDRFWYSYQTREGRRFYLVDPVKKTKGPLFDHAKMAAQLTLITRIPYDAQNLPFNTVRFVRKDAAFEFNFQVPVSAVIPTTKPRETTNDAQQAARGGEDDDASLDPQQGVQQTGRQGGGRGARAGGPGNAPAQPRNKTLYFEYDMAAAKVTLLEDYKVEPRPLRWASLSPDKKTVLFARNHNLYMMDAENYAKAVKSANDSTIVEVQLTTDGDDYYGFSSRSGGRSNQDDQQQQQQQQQQDEDQQQEQREEGDAKNARVAPVGITWSRDSTKFSAVRRDVRKVKDLWVIYFTRLSRDMHRLDVCVADTATGEVRPIVEERLNTYIESKPLRLANNGSELAFWSERDGWGHYYLYDAATGALKNRITDGEFVTTSLESIDDKLRVAYITAAGREKGEDPYYIHLYRVGLDGTGMKLLAAGDASHSAVRQPREQHLQQHLEREESRHQGDREGWEGHLRVRHREELRSREQPERAPDARARRDRQQRPSRQYLPPRRRSD
jgi:dipeptidyl-peptidase 4